MKVEHFLRQRQVIITVGTGGVGKTSISAAMAYTACRLGQKSLVLTVDPARRFASALKVKVGDEEQEVTHDGISFYASMLDLKRSMDRLVIKYAPSKDLAEAVLNSRIYRIVSESIAGSQEYVAAERLYEVYAKGEFDTIILDTPPAYEAIDFIRAPERVTEFFSDRFLRWFVGPMAKASRFSFDLVINRMPRIFKPLTKLSGVEFLREFFDFVAVASELFEDMKNRTDEVLAMLRSRRTSFVYVTAPIPGAIEDFKNLKNALREMGLRLDAVIINRFQPELTTPQEREMLNEKLGSSRITMLAEYYSKRREIHERALQAFLSQRVSTVVTIDEIPEGISGLEGLRRLSDSLMM